MYAYRYLQNIPTVILIEFVQDGKTQTYRVCIALFLLLLGVGIATVTDLKVSKKGTYLAYMFG